MDDPAPESLVEWREWGPKPFADAAASDRPILLSITASWCAWCRRMDAGAYAEPRVAAVLHHDYVPIRVDADRHPRVRDRYNVGGFPSTLFLTPSGHLVAAASTLEADPLRRMLDRISDAWAEDGEGLGRLPHTLRDGEPPVGEVTADVERYINGQVDAQFDDEHGGWGTEAKFPLPETIEFALKRQQGKATRTLDVVTAALADPADGGFFRHAGERDWSSPTREKLLSVNAGLLRAFSHAYLVTGEDRYRATAAETIDYLSEVLWTGEGFANAQVATDYFDLDDDERRAAERPPVDPTIYVAPNARAATALTWFVAYTDDERAWDLATETLSTIESAAIDGGVVVHALEDGEPGLLSAQAAAVEAFANAAQVLDPGYVDVAVAVADETIGRLQADAGAFRDGPLEGPGLLDEPLYPIDENARLADALVDLHHLTDADRFLDAAAGAVGAFAGAADRMGPQVAGYGTAASRVVRHPLVIAVGTAPGTDLHRAALRMADHEKVVIPGSDRVEAGTAALLTADGPRGAATTPTELATEIVDYDAALRDV